MKNIRQWAIETLVPEDVYTDRKEFIDYFYNAALNAVKRRTKSTVLLGQRRMGKTEIFKRVVNKLFFEQDYKDSGAVIPVYYQFPDVYNSRKDFVVEYIENFIRWYTAFKTQDKRILSKPENITELLEFVQNNINISEGFSIAIGLITSIYKHGIDSVASPEKKAVMLPREVAAIDDITIAIFIDEFQNTCMPHLYFSISGYYQEGVESPTCPHFVTGSAMSILADEILGKGALYGRFRSKLIETLPDYYGNELAQKAAKYYQANISEIMAPVISDRCGGNPFYITSVIQQAAEQNKIINDESSLNEMLGIDITSGFIWGELSDQVNRWIERINEYGITKWILYLAALEENDEINLNQIRQKLFKYEQKELSIEKIKEILIKLARGDLLEYKKFGNWFGKIHDPILNDFLKIWGQIEVEKLNRHSIVDEALKKYQSINKRFSEYKGYLAEIYMIQILWNGQRKTLPGIYFNYNEDIKIPDRFSYIDQRHRPGAGIKMEVDIYGAAGTEIWLAESKWWNKPVGSDVVNHLMAQAEIVKQREEKYLKTLRLWIFAHNGVTEPAMDIIRENRILLSTRKELDQLLETVKLRKLPNLSNNENP